MKSFKQSALIISLALVILLANNECSQAQINNATLAYPQQHQDMSVQLPVLSDAQHPLKGGESHAYRISVTAGQFIYALVDQQGIDVEIVLSNSDRSEERRVGKECRSRWSLCDDKKKMT